MQGDGGGTKTEQFCAFSHRNSWRLARQQPRVAINFWFAFNDEECAQGDCYVSSELTPFAFNAANFPDFCLEVPEILRRISFQDA